MNIVVAQISEDEGLSIHHLYPDGEPGLIGEEGHLIGQTEVSLQASRAGEKVGLLGSVSAVVGFECDRCLATLSVPVERSFDLIYVPPLGTGEEHELGENDLSLGFYQDGIIHVDDLAREQIELALPMARLCTEDCRGLCPECGANLNLSECACSKGQADVRWGALAELKSKLN
ncbi:MAG: DUF177 domain-containing protein [Acidobacteriota bacterium]